MPSCSLNFRVCFLGQFQFTGLFGIASAQNGHSYSVIWLSSNGTKRRVERRHHSVTQHPVDIILTASKQYIPQRRLTDFKRAHPWMNDRCRATVASKIAVEARTFITPKHAAPSFVRSARLKKFAKPQKSSKQWLQINRG